LTFIANLVIIVTGSIRYIVELLKETPGGMAKLIVLSDKPNALIVPSKTFASFSVSDELLVFLKHPAIFPTNNAAEQSIRNAVLFRKITFGNMTKRGKRNVAVIMTIIRTAMLRKLDPIGVLREIMLNDAPLMPEAP
jgi:hypothetical protein